MPGLHLSHKINWTDAIQLFTCFRDPGLDLPICEYQKIHIIDKKTKIQIEHRDYLHNKLCVTKESHAIIGKKRFYKTTKKVTIDLGKRYYNNHLNDKELEDSIPFVKQLVNTIIEFAETERKKYQRNSYINNKKLNHLNEKEYVNYITKKKKDNGMMESIEEKEIVFHHCLCWWFHYLIEVGNDDDIDLLFTLTNNQIKSVFSCLHGGQAVGNNTNFLMYYLMKTYILTNVIYAATDNNDDLMKHPEKWGPMAPNHYFRNMLSSNCDGQTFLYQSRPYLMEDVYMKDLTATKQLCKNCFRFIYILYMMRVEVYGKQEAEDWLKHQILLAL